MTRIRLSVFVGVLGIAVYLLLGEAAVHLMGWPRVLWRPSLALVVACAAALLWLELEDGTWEPDDER